MTTTRAIVIAGLTIRGPPLLSAGAGAEDTAIFPDVANDAQAWASLSDSSSGWGSGGWGGGGWSGPDDTDASGDPWNSGGWGASSDPSSSSGWGGHDVEVAPSGSA
ncbi:hypothetical protein C8R43DRAFT_1117412 [Mycena crocata]|nr:hypothetical protein C8R43DRAFT_1117412 [Mycena crocata]